MYWRIYGTSLLHCYFQVMTAASYWSLLAPAIDMASSSSLYGEDGKYAFVPVSIGFFLGALFVYGSDELLSLMVMLQYIFLKVIHMLIIRCHSLNV